MGERHSGPGRLARAFVRGAGAQTAEAEPAQWSRWVGLRRKGAPPYALLSQTGLGPVSRVWTAASELTATQPVGRKVDR